MSDNKELQLISTENIKDKIYNIRGVQVMLDSDLAQLYGYEVRTLNQQVRRNITRFPIDFMFELSVNEIEMMKSQFVISQNFFKGQEGGRRKPPIAFTEQGIYMLSTVLKGELAERQSIAIMRAFRRMRHYFINNEDMFKRLETVEFKQLQYDKLQLETDKKFEEVFKRLDYKEKHTAYLFFSGQLFDAKKFIDDLIAIADKEITLIDNYTNFNTLSMLKNKKKGVNVKIITTKRNGINQNSIKIEKKRADGKSSVVKRSA